MGVSFIFRESTKIAPKKWHHDFWPCSWPQIAKIAQKMWSLIPNILEKLLLFEIVWLLVEKLILILILSYCRINNFEYHIWPGYGPQITKITSKMDS